MKIWLAAALLMLAGCATPTPGHSSTSTDSASGLPALPVAVTEGAWAPHVLLNVADATGDATDYNADLLANQAFRSLTPTCSNISQVIPQVPDACKTTAPLVPTSPTQGVPAPPALDVQEISLREATDGLHLSWQVASLSADPAQFLADPGLGTEYKGYWASGMNATCAQEVVLYFHPYANGIRAHSLYVHSGASCGARASRAYGVDYHIQPGTPGYLNQTVPWAMIPQRAAQESFGGLHGIVSRDSPDLNQQAIVSPRGPYGMHQYDIGLADYTVDSTDNSGSSSLMHGGASVAPLSGSPLQSMPLDALVNTTKRPDLQYQAVQAIFTPANLSFDFTMLKVEDPPQDQSFYVQFDEPSGSIVSFSFQVRNGQRSLQSYVLIAPDGHVETVPMRFEAVAGTPGHLRFTFNRADLEPMAPGDTLSRILTDTDLGGINNSTALAGGESIEFLAHVQTQDAIYGGPFVVPDFPGAAQKQEIALKDAVGDASMPPDAIGTTPAQADILAARIQVNTPNAARMTITVGDLSTLRVPPTYNAVFYGMSVQTPEGATLVGFYQDNANPGRYICGRDHTLLAATPLNPLDSPVTTIYGNLLGPAGAAGLLSFQVPLSCFGVLDSAVNVDLQVERFKAASYLIRTTANGVQSATVQATDSVDSTDPATLIFRSAPVATVTPSFLEQPFGLSHFYDIGGIAISAIGALGGLVLVVRRRRRFRNYLRALETAKGRHRGDLDALLAALRDLRAKVQRDLLRNRLPTDHYGLIMERLDRELSLGRTRLLESRFPAIPDALVQRIQHLLADGRLETADFNHVRGRMASYRLPAATQRGLETELRRWLAQDA